MGKVTWRSIIPPDDPIYRDIISAPARLPVRMRAPASDDRPAEQARRRIASAISERIRQLAHLVALGVSLPEDKEPR